MIKCCIFDLDGTILNTITTITHFVNKTLHNHNIDSVSEDECKYFAGNGARILIKRALASKGMLNEALMERILGEYNAAYDENPLYLTAPFDGIESLISSLRDRGIKLAVLSNKPDSTVKSIVDNFFGGKFDAVFGGREGVPLKPDPTIPREIVKSLGVSESETAWIGDTATDVETGKNLGVKLNIGVLWGFRQRAEFVTAGADVIVKAPDEILEVVLKVE